jgi:Domain of unknown function (DUF4082)
VISAVTATPAITSATITWNTNKLSTSRVDYGTTIALGTTTCDATMVTEHSLALSGLTQDKTYFYRVTSVDGLGNTTTLPVAPATVSFLENAVAAWNSSVTPWTTHGSTVEVGIKFRADVAGVITAVRFYKAAANTGAHIGNLWTSTGRCPSVPIRHTSCLIARQGDVTLPIPGTSVGRHG